MGSSAGAACSARSRRRRRPGAGRRWSDCSSRAKPSVWSQKSPGAAITNGASRTPATPAAAIATRAAARAAAALHGAASTAPATAASPTSKRKAKATPASTPAAAGERRASRSAPKPERERGRVRMRDGRERHGGGHGQPGGERQGLRSIAASERVGHHADRGVQCHAHDAPGDERGSEHEVETAGQVVLAGAVVRVEVAIGQLAVGDSRAGLQHQPLVVRVDPPPDRDAREERAEREQDPVADPRPHQDVGETPASDARRTAVVEPGGLQRANPRARRGSARGERAAARGAFGLGDWRRTQRCDLLWRPNVGGPGHSAEGEGGTRDRSGSGHGLSRLDRGGLVDVVATGIPVRRARSLREGDRRWPG